MKAISYELSCKSEQVLDSDCRNDKEYRLNVIIFISGIPFQYTDAAADYNQEMCSNTRVCMTFINVD